MSVIVTCNAGSSNTKLAAFDVKTLKRHGETIHRASSEISEWLCSIGTLGIKAIGHRVVQGGREFSAPVHITDGVLEKLKSFIPLAPLHQPAAIALIEEARRLYPNIRHIACFDTAFHRTVPEIERRLPLPQRFRDEGMLRYGFHGLSYQHIADVLPGVAGKIARGRVIVAHLGSGASLCAMENRQSVATTMGFSTLDGLMMGTRCGALDPGAILYLLQQKKMSVEEVETLLYHHSGLKGVSGISSEVKELEHSKDVHAQEAIGLFCYLAAKQLCGLLPTLGGLDALVFTGGIGEHSSVVRAGILARLKWLGIRLGTARNEKHATCITTPASPIPVYVIPADEELVIARACRWAR